LHLTGGFLFHPVKVWGNTVMDPDSENTQEMSPARKKVLTILAHATVILAFSGIAYIFLAPLLKIMHISLLTFVMQPMGIVFVVVWMICVLALTDWIHWIMKWILNPVTPEEEQDPLIREVVLTCSFDRAWDLCYASLYSAWRWWITADRPQMYLVAWRIGGEWCQIRFSLNTLANNKYRIFISGKRFFKGRWRYAAAHDLSLRCSIRTLDAIEKFLHEQNQRDLYGQESWHDTTGSPRRR
jgi:hypothetical protein